MAKSKKRKSAGRGKGAKAQRKMRSVIRGQRMFNEGVDLALITAAAAALTRKARGQA